jgi:hypothetical protein
MITYINDRFFFVKRYLGSMQSVWIINNISLSVPRIEFAPNQVLVGVPSFIICALPKEGRGRFKREYKFKRIIIDIELAD